MALTLHSGVAAALPQPDTSLYTYLAALQAAQAPAPINRVTMAGPAAPDLSFLNVAPAQTAPVLEKDPAFLAYQRALGLESSNYQADVARREGVVQSDTQRQLGDLVSQGERQRTGISGNLEARGLFRSGEHEQALAHQRANEGSQQGAIQAAAAQRIADLHTTLTQQLAEVQRREAETRLQYALAGYA